MTLFKKTIPTPPISQFDPNDYINNDPNFPIRRGFVENSWMYGSFRTLSKPSMLYYNGSTYSLWYKEKAFNNQVGIFKQTDDSLESSIVNNGTVGQEPINHPAPMLHINKTTGHIYVLQNRFHVDSIKVWKSEFPEDISSFNFIGEFGSFTSYLGHLEGDESDIVILTRAGATELDFSLSIIMVNLDTLVHTQRQISDVETNIPDTRHYLLVPYQYGTSTKTYFGLGHRNQPPTGTGYYKFSLFATTKGGNYEVFENISGSFSRNVATSGLLTDNDLETNYAAIGSNSARTTIISEGKMIVLNDDIYLVWMSDDANSRFSVRKFTYGSSTTSDFLIPVTTIIESPIWYGPVYMRYNGTNFVFTIFENDGQGGVETNLYVCDVNFNNWTKVDVDLKGDNPIANNEGSGYFYGMPTNLNDAVASGNKYMMITKDKDSQDGEFAYAIITNPWTI